METHPGLPQTTQELSILAGCLRNRRHEARLWRAEVRRQFEAGVTTVRQSSQAKSGDEHATRGRRATTDEADGYIVPVEVSFQNTMTGSSGLLCSWPRMLIEPVPSRKR